MALDDFNRANNASLGTNWTTCAGMNAPQISGNQWTGNASGNAASYWNALTPSNDQWCSAVYKASNDLGPIVRVSTVATTWYEFNWDSFGGNAYSMWKVIAGSYTQLGAGVSGTPSVGDVLRLEVSGTTLTAKVNGATIMTRTDAGIASGRIGLVGYGFADSFDDFDGGSLTAVAASLVYASNRPMRTLVVM